MIQESEGKPGMPAVSAAQLKQTANGPQIQYNLLSSPFNPGPVIDFLLPGCKPRQELNTALSDYISYIEALVPGKDIQKYSGLLEPSKYLPSEFPENGSVSLISSLHSLELLKNSLLIVEINLLSILAANQ
jgi:hypothetical protein